MGIVHEIWGIGHEHGVADTHYRATGVGYRV
jgi:hypothetical protein